MAQEFGVPFLGIVLLRLWIIVGRAPIDPNFVLAIERNQQNRIQNGEENRESNENSTIVDEYKKLALYDVFKRIVSKLVDVNQEWRWDIQIIN
jgi:hypothetical protein